MCGNAAVLLSNRIAWLNYHGPYNTGLPDYWLLVINEIPNKWGLPTTPRGTAQSATHVRSSVKCSIRTESTN